MTSSGSPGQVIGSSNPVSGGSKRFVVQPDRGELSRRGKRTTMFFIVLGLLTFVAPTIKFDPPVRGENYLSPYTVAQQAEQLGSIEPKAILSSMAVLPFEFIYLIYLLFFAASGAVLLFPFRKLLIGIALTGLACLLLPFRGLVGVIRLASATSFSIQSSRGGDLMLLWILFAVVLVIVAFASWTDSPA